MVALVPDDERAPPGAVRSRWWIWLLLLATGLLALAMRSLNAWAVFVGDGEILLGSDDRLLGRRLGCGSCAPGNGRGGWNPPAPLGEMPQAGPA